jgi:hypothetical protein
MSRLRILQQTYASWLGFSGVKSDPRESGDMVSVNVHKSFPPRFSIVYLLRSRRFLRDCFSVPRCSEKRSAATVMLAFVVVGGDRGQRRL